MKIVDINTHFKKIQKKIFFDESWNLNNLLTSPKKTTQTTTYKYRYTFCGLFSLKKP